VARIDGHSDRQSGPPLSRLVAELAARQWGVLSRAQLRGLGASPAAVDVWVRRNRLHVVYRGVYALGHTSLKVEGRRLAAVLACGQGAVLSHRSAAAHWGLLATDQTRIDVTAPRSRDGVPGIRLHSSRSLDAPEHPRLEVDFYFPTLNLVVETDGWETHKTKAAFQRDRRKDAALTSAGCRVMRFTYEDVVYEPNTVVARLTPRSAPA
jgi:hypothetical protein